ncbi:uncharacterized protein KY384_003673 [Bacidia gigantensis]|uniref:uncharacterized protein n=1 Tax=Bacidia gigantensis TaxID=2732470 RepID=UPI001D0541B6|nr:uncharacterized protein KY384_003673 [Bacidia gigantensis]KAG8532036.1 hypothetical protein KY384_003673 [Bacidia gigantensis]
MDRRPVYSIFPAPPTSHATQQRNRPSTDSRARPSLEQPPYPPPSTPLPPIPKQHPASDQASASPHQPLPPTPDSLRSTRPPSRRKASPSREFADFQRELAQPSRSQASSVRGRPSSPRQRSNSRQSNFAPSTGSRPKPLLGPPEDPMQTSTLSTSSTSSLSLSKPPILSPSTTVAPTPPPVLPNRTSRPNTVYFHGSIGGAGNYRKVIRESNRAPRAYAENAEPVRRSSPTRFLSSIFGSQKGRGNGGGAVNAYDERASGSEDSVREEVDLGAAEALRRKMMGAGRRKRGGS